MTGKTAFYLAALLASRQFKHNLSSMKKSFLPSFFIVLLASASAALANAGPAPWSSGAYYPGYLNGKYFGVVSGNNISGVLGFAIADGAPPFRSDTVTEIVVNLGVTTTVERTLIVEDVTQNYFAIFVEGRTYVGRTSAGLDITAKKVAGALIGTDPPRNIPFTASPVVAGAAPVDPLPIVNRGLSGGFEGKIKSTQDPITFKANGQLSTPANRQTVDVTSIPAVYDPADLPPSPAGTITNQVSTGIVTTETTPFKVKGTRTSYLFRNPQGDADAAAASTGTTGTAP